MPQGGIFDAEQIEQCTEPAMARPSSSNLKQRVEATTGGQALVPDRLIRPLVEMDLDAMIPSHNHEGRNLGSHQQRGVHP